MLKSLFQPKGVAGVAALVLFIIMVTNLAQKGKQVNTFAKNTENFVVSSMKALEVGPQYGH